MQSDAVFSACLENGKLERHNASCGRMGTGYCVDVQCARLDRDKLEL